jgi:MFS family permease
LIAGIGPGWLVALDAASFAFLGIQAWRTHTGESATEQPVDTHAAESGFRLLRRRRDLLALTAVTWVFFFLYGPVEAALPVYVARDLRADAGLLGAYWTAFGVGALAATLVAGTLRGHDVRRITVWIVAGWGACLIPFAFAPVGVTVACFALGGLIYGPFIPLSYSLFQSATTTANLPAVLAARSALVMVSTPLGTAIGGPLVGAFGASETLAASGLATVALAIAASIVRRRGRPGADRAAVRHPRLRVPRPRRQPGAHQPAPLRGCERNRESSVGLKIVWRRASTRTRVTCSRRPWARSGPRPTISCRAE